MEITISQNQLEWAGIIVLALTLIGIFVVFGRSLRRWLKPNYVGQWVFLAKPDRESSGEGWFFVVEQFAKKIYAFSENANALNNRTPWQKILKEHKVVKAVKDDARTERLIAKMHKWMDNDRNHYEYHSEIRDVIGKIEKFVETGKGFVIGD